MAKKIEELNLKDILPSSIASYADVAQTSETINPELLYLAGKIGELSFYSRISELESDWLDHLAWQWHVDVYEPTSLTVEQKRYAVENAITTHRFKGTRWAIKTALKTLGYNNIEIQEHWDLDSPPYTFAMTVSPMQEDLIEVTRRYIWAYKPVRSQLISLAFRLCILEFEEAEEKFSWSFGAVIGADDIEEPVESIVPMLQPTFDESPWFRHYYGEDGLYYDGAIRYDSQDESVEYVYISSSSGLVEAENAADSIVNIWKVVIL